MIILAFVLTMTVAVATIWQVVTNVCTLSTLALKILPRPDQVTTIFMVSVPPRHYTILYNLLRYSSSLGVGAAWQDRGPMAKMQATEVITDEAGGSVTTKVEQEIKPGHQDK